MAVDPTLYFIAFGAGIASFVSPCNVALIPTFVSYVGSSSKNWRQSSFMSLLYSLGFSLTFGIIGVIFLAGVMSLENRTYFNLISGIITILLALYLFFNKEIQKLTRKLKEIRKIKKQEINRNMEILENRETRLNEVEISNKLDNPTSFNKYTGYGGAFILGFTTGSSWIACVTPVLGTIISIGAVQNEYSTALYLMILYAMGITVPFIILGALIGFINNRFLAKMIKYGAILEKIFALVLVWMGIEIILSGFGIDGLIEFL
ncbi:cytochrome c biogenesis CcdA family protein [Promethearchaeum syntrophicum]|uniref:Cytochrome c biogenesis CcdA family protein n=1 Tax=Promethearchaeum syntrophicum TaxID=2594042 RepID=A0A5B9DFK3_9ARCH|nr:cytochrome c biogenesis CcdA family protein [Candidatus Prometheoarchaeum syntrophicum]